MTVIYFMYEQCIHHHSAKDTFMRLMWYGSIAVVSSFCCRVNNDHSFHCITCKRLSRLAVWRHIGFTVHCWRAQYYWVSSLPYVVVPFTRTPLQFFYTSELKPFYSPRDLPILIAVSCLSPVRIQILMSAFIRVSMVSGTLSWSLSSIAVAPRSCRFYTRNEEKQIEKGKKESE